MEVIYLSKDITSFLRFITTLTFKDADKQLTMKPYNEEF